MSKESLRESILTLCGRLSRQDSNATMSHVFRYLDDAPERFRLMRLWQWNQLRLLEADRASAKYDNTPELDARFLEIMDGVLKNPEYVDFIETAMEGRARADVAEFRAAQISGDPGEDAVGMLLRFRRRPFAERQQGLAAVCEMDSPTRPLGEPCSCDSPTVRAYTRNEFTCIGCLARWTLRIGCDPKTGRQKT